MNTRAGCTIPGLQGIISIREKYRFHALRSDQKNVVHMFSPHSTSLLVHDNLALGVEQAPEAPAKRGFSSI